MPDLTEKGRVKTALSPVEERARDFLPNLTLSRLESTRAEAVFSGVETTEQLKPFSKFSI